MAYVPKTIHSGEQSGGYSTKNAQDLAKILEDMETAIAAAGDVTPAAAATAAALTGTLTGTTSNVLADITFNSTWSQGQADTVNLNFKNVQDEINKLVTDVAAIRTAVNAIITATAG